MRHDSPLVSICLPTFNREDLLDLCLTRLGELNRVDLSYEVVVSDNCSTDRTPEIVQEHATTLQRVSYHRMKDNKGPLLNWHNAIRQATGEFVLYLGDDDRLIPEGLAAHVATMQARPDLVATYADWISFDDNSGTELHRYYPFIQGRCEYRPDQIMPLLEFLCGNHVLPETGLLRRVPLLRALPFLRNGYPYLQYLFQMSRQGTIAFDPAPFYVENRFVQAHLDRSNWQGMGLWLVNDEMRTTLEMIVLKAFQAAGHETVPVADRQRMRDLIDGRIHRRLKLEAKAACQRGDFITASELNRRWTLWHGADAPHDMQHEIDYVIVPATLQAIKSIFDASSQAKGVAFHGFRSEMVPGAFTRTYPEVPVERDPQRAKSDLAAGGKQCLHVAKTEAALGTVPFSGHVVLFDNLLDFYQTMAFDLVLDEL